MAKLFFRYGAMNSGKSTILMQIAFNYKERGMDVYVIKPKIDSKGDNKIVSRIGVEQKVDKLVSNNDNIFNIISNVKDKKISCVFIDEVQFLTEKQIYELLDITIKLNIPVICFGLRADFSMTPFKASALLLSLAHEITEIKTICSCGRKAMFNLRKLNGKPVFSGDSVAIDGEHDITYESVCGECYYKLKNINK